MPNSIKNTKQNYAVPIQSAKTKHFFSITILLLFFLINEKTNAQSPDWLWAKAMNGIGGDEGRSIALDASGSVYTTGRFYGTTDFDPGSGTFNLTSTGLYDIFISKLDDSGNFVWAKAMGGTGSINVGYSIALDASGNVYTSGAFQGTVDFDPGTGVFNLTSASGRDIFISKLDGSGNFVWAKTMIGGMSDEDAYSIAIDPLGSGGVYTTGSFGNTVDFDPGAGVFNLTAAGTSDIFISKLDASGNFVWAKAIGGIDADYGRSIALDLAGSGDIYTTGSFEETVDFDPGAGVFNLTAAPGSDDVFISKLDSSGNFVWAKAMGGTGSFSFGQSIALEASGKVYITGYFTGTVDFDPGSGIFNLTSVGTDIFISKLDGSGNFIWANRIGGTGGNGNISFSIALDAAGNVYTTGYFSDTVDFDPGAGTFNLTSTGFQNIFISKLDGSGNFAWAKAIGGTGSDAGLSIAFNASGNCYLTGPFFSPSVSFGLITLTNADITGNTSDIFIAKLDAATGIENAENINGISVFPNPATGTVTLQSTIQQVNHSTITITNTLGEKIYGQKIISEKTEINLSHQPSGIYFLHLKTENNSISQKLIIQK